jgi:hypothetical protein
MENYGMTFGFYDRYQNKEGVWENRPYYTRSFEKATQRFDAMIKRMKRDTFRKNFRLIEGVDITSPMPFNDIVCLGYIFDPRSCIVVREVECEISMASFHEEHAPNASWVKTRYQIFAIQDTE